MRHEMRARDRGAFAVDRDADEPHRDERLDLIGAKVRLGAVRLWAGVEVIEQRPCTARVKPGREEERPVDECLAVGAGSTRTIDCVTSSPCVNRRMTLPVRAR